jgi:hypothetical protein
MRKRAHAIAAIVIGIVAAGGCYAAQSAQPYG